jgi:hypothetical protein
MSVRRFLRESNRPCGLTSGSTTVRVTGTTEGLAVGDSVAGIGVPDGTTISSIAANVSITLSAAATASGDQQLHFVGQLANVGTTGNNTHPSVPVDGAESVRALSIEFEVTAAGATPTVTFIAQGSMDGPDIPDASSDFFTLALIPPSGGAETQAPAAVTTVSVNEYTLDLARHPCRKLRLVTSANTNITYEADVYGEGFPE